MPSQLIPQESPTAHFRRMVIPVQLRPGEIKLVRLAPASNKKITTDIKAKRSEIANSYWQVKPGKTGIELHDTTKDNRIRLSWRVLDDLSDTWSHGISRFSGEVLGEFARRRVLVDERGPVRGTMSWLGRFNQSQIRVSVKLYHNDPYIELVVDLFWAQQKAVLKMIVETGRAIGSRYDGQPGGYQQRPLDGNEYPMHDWTILQTVDATQIGLISGDIYGLDVAGGHVGLTLVRGCRYALHRDDVSAAEDPGQFPTDFVDQGEHRFRILIRAGSDLDPAKLQRIACQLQQPPIHWDPPYRKT